MSKQNQFKTLIEGAKAKENTPAPLQSDKNGNIEPIEKTFLISIPEHKLMALKKMAVDKRTNVRKLISLAIDELYFK